MFQNAASFKFLSSPWKIQSVPLRDITFTALCCLHHLKSGLKASLSNQGMILYPLVCLWTQLGLQPDKVHVFLLARIGYDIVSPNDHYPTQYMWLFYILSMFLWICISILFSKWPLINFSFQLDHEYNTNCPSFEKPQHQYTFDQKGSWMLNKSWFIITLVWVLTIKYISVISH